MVICHTCINPLPMSVNWQLVCASFYSKMIWEAVFQGSFCLNWLLGFYSMEKEVDISMVVKINNR